MLLQGQLLYFAAGYQNVVEVPGVIVLEDVNHVPDEFHVHVLEAAARAIKDNGDHAVLVFAVDSLQKVEEHALHVVHVGGTLDVLLHVKNQQLLAIHVPIS
jgi:hypothetical protein